MVAGFAARVVSRIGQSATTGAASLCLRARGRVAALDHRKECGVADERVILVTGAAGGIGAATARTLVAEGAAVVGHDLRLDERLQSLADELGDSAHALSCDLRDPAAADALWHEAVAWRGHIDVLVNNAGIYEAARPEDDLATWQASWERTLAICLVSP